MKNSPTLKPAPTPKRGKVRGKQPRKKVIITDNHIFSEAKDGRGAPFTQYLLRGIRRTAMADLKIAIRLYGYDSVSSFLHAQITNTILVAKDQHPGHFTQLHANPVARQILHLLDGVITTATIEEIKAALDGPANDLQIRQALLLLEKEGLVTRREDFVLGRSSGRPRIRWTLASELSRKR